MNFNLLFSTVSVLSFIIEFPVNTEERQDYFLFEGNNKSAHLFRENGTLYLHFTHDHGEMFSIYNIEIDEENFQFAWNGFQVDGKEMMSQNANGKIGRLEFEHFTFISPIVEIYEDSLEPVYRNLDAVNYWYFLIMMFAVAIICDSKTRAVNFLKKILKLEESDYVTTDQAYVSTQQKENMNESNV